MAMVVPSLKLLLSITWSPSRTGISKMVPVICAIMLVFAELPLEIDPRFIIW